MATYNMIKNSFLTSTVVSGTGNLFLTSEELNSLINNNITSSMISLEDTDVLFLDVDLGYRLKIDTIFLYTSDLTKLANVNFYFKNNSEEVYTICSKDTSSTAYLGILPSPKAPRYIRCTVSGIAMDLYEFQILNNDNIVGFGEDGNSTETLLNDAPQGFLGEIQAIDIFNNTLEDEPANAYVCVDYTATDDDTYIDIAASSSGPFVNILDGTITNFTTKGVHNNTKSVIFNAKESIQIDLKTPIDNTHPYYIGQLPLTTCYYPSTPLGFRHATTYDHINKRIYTAFWLGDSDTGAAINLWYYDILLNTWVFRGSLASASWHTSFTRICCDASKVYFVGGLAYNTLSVHYHELSGELNNLTKLVDLPELYTTTSTTAVADFNNNLYVLYNSNPYYNQRKFLKINTTTGAITDLSTSYIAPQYQDTASLITYDYVSNKIYVLIAYFASGDSITNNYYIQEYTVANNTWITQFFNYGDRIYRDHGFIYFFCHNRSLYFYSHKYNGKVYKYNMLTDIVTYINTEIVLSSSSSNCAGFVVTEAQDSLSDVSFYILGGTVTMPFSLYGYNTTFSLLGSNAFYVNRSGIYISDIISLADKNLASYFCIRNTSLLGKTSVSTDVNLHDGLIEIRSSDIPPTPKNIVMWLVRQPNSHSLFKVLIYDTNTNQTSVTSVTLYMNGWSDDAGKLRVNQSTGNFVFVQAYSTTINVRFLDRTGSYFRSFNFETTSSSPDVDYDIDPLDGVWIFQKTNFSFYHYTTWGSLIGSKVIAGLYHLSACKISDGIWFVDSVAKALVKADRYLNAIYTINLLGLGRVCTNYDDSCWVIDNADVVYKNTVKHYSAEGELQHTISTDVAFSLISTDFDGGFYALSTSSTPPVLKHYDGNGNLLMTVSGLTYDNSICGGRYGVVLHSSSLLRIRYISNATKSIIWTKWYSELYTGSDSYTLSYVPAILSFALEDQNNFLDAPKIIPQSTEVYWGNSEDSLDWQIVPKDGYFLPKVRYHQLRLTLRNFDGISTPIVHSIVLAPAVLISDIPPQQSKPLFIRSNIPAGQPISQLNTRIKVWWDVKEN